MLLLKEASELYGCLKIPESILERVAPEMLENKSCLLYTSDAADD